MPTTARVARIHEYGPPEVLRFEDIVVGEPGDDEALIRNTVIGLNFVDVYYRRGSLPVPAFPAIIGDEAAGVVEAVGKNVKNVSVGDRVVYGDIAFGAYATARLHPADRLVRIPAGVFDSVGADTFRGSLAVLRPRGTLVQFGKASGSPEPVDPFKLAPRALYLTWPILPHYTSTAEDLAIAAADLFDAIATGI